MIEWLCFLAVIEILAHGLLVALLLVFRTADYVQTERAAVQKQPVRPPKVGNRMSVTN